MARGLRRLQRAGGPNLGARAAVDPGWAARVLPLVVTGGGSSHDGGVHCENTFEPDRPTSVTLIVNVDGKSILMGGGSPPRAAKPLLESALEAHLLSAHRGEP
jgi:hypothetical protein